MPARPALPEARRHRLRVALLSALAAALTCASAAQRAAASDVLLGTESAAVTDDARALLLNPAAIGRRYPFEGYFAFARPLDGPDAGAGLLAWRNAGLAVTRVRGEARRYGATLAAGDDPLRFGWSGALLAGDGHGERTVRDHTLGLLARPSPWASLGATITHLNAPVFRGERLRRERTFALALRPLALDRTRAHGAGTRFTLAADVVWREGDDASAAHARLSAELEPVAGVVLAASGEHGGARLSLSLRGTRATLHAAQSRRGNEDAFDARTGEGGAVSVHAGEERTALMLPNQRRIAVVRIGGRLADERLSGGMLGASGVPSAPIHRQLERALADPLTRGVLLDLRGVSGMAQLEELRPRLDALRNAGKPVVAHLPYGGGRGDLYLASAANRVFASEPAIFMGLGLRVERRSYKSALESLGVRFDRASVGRYKSAYRGFSVDSTPPADTIVIEQLLRRRQDLFVNTVCMSRGLEPGRLLGVLDGRVWPSSSLAEAGVIDSVGWRPDALAAAGRLAGLGRRPRTVEFRHAPRATRAWTEPARLAVVYAGGAIVTGRSGADALDGATMGDETLVAQLRRAFHAPGVKAVVLRVESGGGSALASHLIDHEIEMLKRETHRPFVVSMGAVAASGGYFIACHGDRIFADRHTLTGSIGVVFVKPSIEGLYDRLHVRQEDFGRGDYMRAGSLARDWRPEDQAAADSSIGRLYATFVGRVADGRGMRLEDVFEHAQGRPWFAGDALERHLVDEIGGLDAALAEARRRGGIPAGEAIRLLEFHHPRGPWLERVIGGWVQARLADAVRLPDLEGVQARADEDLVAD